MTSRNAKITRLIAATLLALLLTVTVFASTALAADARTTSPFGMCSHMLWGYSHSEIDGELNAMHNAGASWLRVDVSWRDIETSDNIYNQALLSSLDYIVSSAAAKGIAVQAVVMEIPNWANGNAGMWTPPTNDAKFTEFMQFLSARYAGRITYWEIANEVNEIDFWNVPRISSPARYTQFLKAGYQGVKAGNPVAMVISAGLAGSDDQYLQQMYDAGAKGYFDLLGVHAYTRGRSPYYVDNDTPSSTYDGLKIMKDTMGRNGEPDKKIWVTETGWQTSTSGYHVTEAQQAQYIQEAFQKVLAEMPYVETLFVYNVRNNGTATNVTTDNFGLMRRDFSAKPALAAYRSAFDASGFGAPTAIPIAATPVAPAVTIKTSKKSVRRTSRVSLQGTVRTALSVTSVTQPRVIVQRKSGSKWIRVATLKANSSGRYSTKIRLAKRGLFTYRAVLTTGTGTAISKTVRIRVR